MKIALAHELLTMKGGAERVLRVAADMFPDAPIFTFLYDEKAVGDWFPKDRIVVSYLQKYAWFSMNHHWYLSRFPSAVQAFDFSEYDLVLSFSSAFMHGIVTNGKPPHLCYVHSPARYLWDRTHDVLKRAGKVPFRRGVLERVFHNLRIWDSEAADRPDKLLAASKEVQRRIELYWRRESDVLYPPVDDYWFLPVIEPKGDYYLIVSTLARYKRIDLAIKACNKLQVPLKIAGTGPDLKRLKRHAGKTVEFLGRVEEEELKKLYTGARSTLFPGDEDFGIVPLESMACGTPVIAYKSGGAPETVKEGSTGVFFSEPMVESLMEAIDGFNPDAFDPKECKEQAEKFSQMRFEDALKKEIAALT